MAPSRTLFRSLAAVGAAVLISTALVGCGSSSDDKTLTAKEFRSQANKLCSDADKETEAFGANITEKSSDADVAEAIDKTVARNHELIKDLEALKAPDNLADDVDSMLDSVKAGLVVLDKISSMQDLQTAASGESPFAAADTKAKKLGLDTCAD